MTKKFDPKPLTKDGVTRTPGSPTERVQLLSSGWSEAKPRASKPQGDNKTAK